MLFLSYPIVHDLETGSSLKQHFNNHMITRLAGPVEGCVAMVLVFDGGAGIEGQQQAGGVRAGI